MDIKDLVFDDKRYSKALKLLSDGSVICLEPLIGMFPKRFIESSVAFINGDTINTVGYVGFVTEDKRFFAMSVLTLIELQPSSVREQSIDGNRYVIMDFDKGDVVIKSNTVVKVSGLVSSMYDEFIEFGRIPWYINNEMVNKLYDRSNLLVGRKVVNSPGITRILTGISERDPLDYRVPYRYSAAIKEGKPPHKQGLNAVAMLVDGTFNKLIGGYSKDTMIDALINPDERVTSNEKIIKGEYFE